MKQRKYNKKLFWIGFLMNLLTHNFFLFVPSIILCFLGLWNKICLSIGIALILVDVIVSLIQQIRIKRTIETSTDPNFVPWADILSMDNWEEMVKKVDETVKESENRVD